MLNASEITGSDGSTTPPTAGVEVQPYRDPGQITLVLQVLLVTSAVVAAVRAAQALTDLRLVARLIESQTVTPDDIIAADRRWAVAVGGQLAMMLVTGIAFVVWTHRHYRNLPALGATARRLSEREAIGGWFVPVLNLIWPKQVLDDIWRASATPGQVVWLRPGRPVPKLLHVWWAAWVVAAVTGITSNRDVDDLEGIRSSLILQTIWAFAIASAALLAVLIVGSLGDRQRRHGRGAHLEATQRLAFPTTTKRVFLGGNAMVVGSLAAALFAFGGESTPAEAGDRILIFDLEVGDCFDDHAPWELPTTDETIEVQFVDRLPCNEPHPLELLATFELIADDETFGDMEALLELGLERCVERFAPIVGRSFMDSALDVIAYVQEYDKTIQCAAQRRDGEPLTASVIGSGL